MFDGIDVVILVVDDVSTALDLYVGHLGFAVLHDAAPPAGLGTLIGLDDHDLAADRVVRLGKVGAEGGGLLLVQVPGLPPAVPAGPPVVAGPYALDLYLRDPSYVEGRLGGAGWGFTSEPVHYSLPGTTHPVRERMLRQDHVGLLHALVRHRAHGTRSVLGADDTQQVSEIVALVCLTADLEAARAFATDVLGAREYFHDTFAGSEIETMLDLPEGAGLEAALFRGPRSRNARLEFARPHGVALAPRLPGPSRAVALVVTDRLADLRAGLLDGRHGTVGPLTEVDLGDGRSEAFGLDTVHDLRLVLVQRSHP